MKKILLIVISLLLLTSCKNKTNEPIKETTCHILKLLSTKNDTRIYTYCLDNTQIKLNNKKIDLEDYINNNPKGLEKIIDALELKDILKDGGTKIYKGDITLIKCNTLEGNKDVYIGNKSLNYKQNFCKDNNQTFIRTYKIEEITPYTEQQYTEDNIPVSYGNSFKVTLSSSKNNTKETVIINNLWDITLEKNKTYEFEFLPPKHKIEDTTENIFKSCTIVEIKETNKAESKQIQESIPND